MSKTRKKSAKMNVIHFRTLVCRYARQIVSSVPSFLMLILQAPILLIIVALIYQKDCFYFNTPETAQNIYFANTMVFVLVFMGALMGLLNSYREITKEHEILSREISGGLDPVSYVASKLFVQGVIAAAQTLILCLISLIFIDFNFPNPLADIPLYLLTVFLVTLSSASLGLMISAIVKKSETAVLPLLLIIIAQVVFSGIFMDVGKGANLIGYLMPARWGCSILGNFLHMNSNPINLIKTVFEDSIFSSIVILCVITAVCYAVSVSVIQGKTRRKK